MSQSGIFARESTYLDRYVQIGIAQDRVLSVEFPQSADPDVETEHDLLDRVEAYLNGSREELTDVPVAMTMPTDKREVLEVVRTISWGEEVSVEQLARKLPDGDPEDSALYATIREALAANPAPIFIPTHRVRDGPGGSPPAVEQKLRAVEDL